MGGTVWQHRERYIENSPYFYLDRVTTPVLIVQGTSDRASPPFQSDATFEALRQLGKRVVYLRYDGEGHGPMLYSAANRAHYLNRVVRWFDEYLSEKKVLAP
jgi:dipeptidyl aminopeptidase/acylaminoacyl peptidase